MRGLVGTGYLRLHQYAAGANLSRDRDAGDAPETRRLSTGSARRGAPDRQSRRARRIPGARSRRGERRQRSGDRRRQRPGEWAVRVEPRAARDGPVPAAWHRACGRGGLPRRPSQDCSFCARCSASRQERPCPAGRPRSAGCDAILLRVRADSRVGGEAERTRAAGARRPLGAGEPAPPAPIRDVVRNRELGPRAEGATPGDYTPSGRSRPCEPCGKGGSS